MQPPGIRCIFLRVVRSQIHMKFLELLGIMVPRLLTWSPRSVMVSKLCEAENWPATSYTQVDD